MSKKLLSMLIVLCIVFTLLPVSARAEEMVGAASTNSGTPEEQVLDSGKPDEYYVSDNLLDGISDSVIQANDDEHTVLDEVYALDPEVIEYNIWVRDVNVTSDNAEDVLASTDVAEIDGTVYATLQAAVNAVTEGQTIELLDDINLITTVTIDSDNNNSFTIDLNGKTLNSGSNIAIQHSGTGTLTIKDTGTDGKVTSAANIGSYGTIDLRGGNLVVESGKVENTLADDDANAILKDHHYNGTILVKGGTIIANEGTAIYYGNLPYSSDLIIPSGILIPSGTPVIKGGLIAMNMAPDLSSYTGVRVTASFNYDGSSPSTYEEENITNYKYIKFEPAPVPDALNGTATISNVAPRIGDVLSGSLISGNNTGTLTYVWKADGTEVGTGTSYTVAVADLGKTITLEISSNLESGTITSATTAAVLKKVAPSAPGAPTFTSKTHNTVTLTVNGDYEFSKDGTAWQTDNVFSGLTASTVYTFYQRIAETDDTESSPSSTGFSVTTNSKYSSSSDSGSDRSSLDNNSSHIIITRPTADQPNRPTQGEMEITGKVDGKGNITVNITDKNVIEVFDKAFSDAKKNGNEQNGINVVFRVDTGRKTSSNVTVNLPKTVQDIIIAKKIVNTIIVLDNPEIRIGMDLATVKEINKQAKSDVNISAIRTDNGKLTGEAKNAIGSRPVFDLKVNYGSGKEVYSFGVGSVSVTIPYILGANEKAENVQAVYVDGNGKVHWLVSSVYDSVEKVVHFSTDHFSTYGIGYKDTNTAFTDIASHWAKEDIEFVVSSGLFSGTSITTFSPNTAMTRGMFVTVLGRLANADVSGYNESSFIDVKSDAYYMDYIEWASKNSIVKGIGYGKFAPDQSITREQMAVIMQNYAKIIGFKLPKAHGENTFGDSSKISAYAEDAVKQMQMAGVISGKNGNFFDPQGTATRAEVSAVLRRFVELVISSDIM